MTLPTLRNLGHRLRLLGRLVSDALSDHGIDLQQAPLGRALLLLDKAGVIKLKDNKNILSTVKDITGNDKGLKFRELEAATARFTTALRAMLQTRHRWLDGSVLAPARLFAGPGTPGGQSLPDTLPRPPSPRRSVH